jgi:thiamine biosynthesis lipoprotein
MKNWAILILILSLISCKSEKHELQTLEGFAIGTTYSIKYIDSRNIDFSMKIDSIISAVNKSTSTYISTSDISKINNGDTSVVVDEIFKEVFHKSNRIYLETNGDFDPTIGILVNAWGFGPEEKIENLDSLKVKELLNYVGFDKVKLQNGKVFKKHQEIYFDFNAIGKGFLVDCIGRLFERYNIKNYMVEIGGEIRARGVNQKQIPWRIAIENPNFDGSRSFATIIQLNDESIATSGNYRKYRTAEDGTKYVHTINTKTGFASESNLLSASVISKKDCADVDGYATAFMAMGIEKTKAFLQQHPELKAFLIFSNEKGELATFQTDNLIVD